MCNDPDRDQSIHLDDLSNLVGELRALARGLLNCESGNHSLTPTALAMTALRRAKRVDVEWEDVRWENRAHFFSAVRQAMQHALTDHARKRGARGRDRVAYVPGDHHLLDDLPKTADENPEVLLRVQEALERLNAANPDHADLLFQYFFAGYSIPEIARFRDCSEKTVDRTFKRARVSFLDWFNRCAPG